MRDFVSDLITRIQLITIVVGAGVAFHSFGAAILAFGVTILVMERWQ